MTDRPTPPGAPLRAFLDGLDPAYLAGLLDHAGAGVFNARHAAQCVTEAGTSHHETALQLLTYLSTAIRELEAARAIVLGGLEREVTL